MSNTQPNAPAIPDAPDPALILAEMIRRPVRYTYVGELAQAVVRMPPYILGAIDEMTKLSGRSRNSVMTMLLESGLTHTLEHLDDDTRGRLTRVPHPTKTPEGQPVEFTQGEL